MCFYGVCTQFIIKENSHLKTFFISTWILFSVSHHCTRCRDSINCSFKTTGVTACQTDFNVVVITTPEILRCHGYCWLVVLYFLTWFSKVQTRPLILWLLVSAVCSSFRYLLWDDLHIVLPLPLVRLNIFPIVIMCWIFSQCSRLSRTWISHTTKTKSRHTKTVCSLIQLLVNLNSVCSAVNKVLTCFLSALVPYNWFRNFGGNWSVSEDRDAPIPFFYSDTYYCT